MERITHVCLLPSRSCLALALRSTPSRTKGSKAPPTASLSLPGCFHEVCCMLIASPASESCGGRGTSRAGKNFFFFPPRVLSDWLTQTAACGFSINLWVVSQLPKYPLSFGIPVNRQDSSSSFLPFVKELLFAVKLLLSF